MKTLKYIFLSVIIAVFLLLIVPSKPFITNTSDVLMVSTLLFTIFSGFYIAATLSNYLKLQTLVAQETSGLISLYEACRSQQPDISKKLIETIDKYLIASFDVELVEAVTITQKEFDEVMAVTDKIENKDTNLFCQILSIKSALLMTRQEFDMSSQRIISPFEWIILTILALLNIVLIYSLGDGTIVSSILGVLFGFIIIFILVLINLLDNNTLAEEKMSFLIYQTVFKAIGKLPYFPETSIRSKRVSPPKENYRIGKYKNYPKSFEKEIVVVKVK